MLKHASKEYINLMVRGYGGRVAKSKKAALDVLIQLDYDHLVAQRAATCADGGADGAADGAADGGADGIIDGGLNADDADPTQGLHPPRQLHPANFQNILLVVIVWM